MESIQIRLYESTESKDPVSTWSPEVMYDEAISSPRVYRQGRFVLAKRFAEREKFRFPPPIGETTVYLAAQDEVCMSPAVRATETLILNRKLRHGNNAVLNMCAANAVIESDAAGNRKLTKKKSRGRIDGMTALLMAIGVAPSGWMAAVDVGALIV